MGERTGGLLKRRGVLAGAAALMGAGLAKLGAALADQPSQQRAVVAEVGEPIRAERRAARAMPRRRRRS